MTGRATLASELHRRLRAEIVRLALRPGDTISEAETARRFGVSRQPVREAFIHLADDGFLLIRPQRPTVVRPIAEAAVLAAPFVREAVEADTVRLAAGRWRLADAVALKALLARRAEAVAADREAFHALDQAFHREIARRAGRLDAWAMVDRHKAQMDRVRWLAVEVNSARTLAQHWGIAAALAAREVASAERAMGAHLSAIKDGLGSLRASQGQAFEGPPRRAAEAALSVRAA